MPVLIVHTWIFALKSLIISIFSLAEGWNVYAYCISASVLAGIQCKIYYKNPDYQSEVFFYNFMGVLEIIECCLIMIFKTWSKSQESSFLSTIFLVVVFLYILADLLAFAFLWLRIFKEKCGKRRVAPEETPNLLAAKLSPRK